VLAAPHIPAAKSGVRRHTIDVRVVFEAIIDLLRTCCQWRRFPSDFSYGAETLF
jgi:transposase